MVTSNWFFAFVKARKVGQQSIRGSKQVYSILQDHGTVAKSSSTSLPPTHNRTFWRTNFLFKIEPKRNLSTSHASVANQAQIIWKQLSWIHSYSGLIGPLVHRANYSLVGSAQTFSKFKEYGRYSRLALYHGSRSVLQNNVIKKGSMHNNGNICKNIYFTKPFSSSASGSAGYRAQLAWERLSKLCSYRGHITPSVNKITCAMSLALTRFNIIPSILALVGGELAFSKIAYADGEPLTDNLYSRAQDGHIYITSLIIGVLEIFILFIRTLYLAILFSPAVIMAPFADTLGNEYRKTWLTLVHRTLEKAGPAFIKWGQWAATRPDLFPSDLCSELTKLHTNAPAHSFAYTKRAIEKAFSRTISDIFEDFEEEPVASGSVAQIHRASLRFRHPGQNTKKILVAVKVRHPGVSESIRRDFVIINTVAKISNFIPTLKWLRLDESVQQFAVFMMSQVDLAREAAHLSRFIYNFRSWKDVSFPKPLYPLVHPAVLVETYEHGENVSHYVDELDGHERLKGALAHIGTHALLKMLLVDNFVHADMHPGNILVRVTKSKRPDKGLFRLKPHVVFLDVGMTAELSSTDRVNLLEFFKAVAIRDGRTAAKSTLKLSKKQNCPNPKAFIEEVEKSFTFWGTTEGDVVHPAECMHQLLEQVRRHRVNIDGNVCTVMVTMLVLEGWQRKLDPDYDVMHTLQNLLFKSDWAETLRYTVEGLMAP